MGVMSAPMSRDDSKTIGPLTAGIRNGDRAALTRAITLIESNRADHRNNADRLAVGHGQETAE
jgi:putative protein kinase ArgK-like GTPase of G3E family